MAKKNVVGSRIRKARRAAKPRVTQQDLIARLGVLGFRMSQSTLSKIESGERAVLDYQVLLLAKALGVTVGWLMDEEESQKSARRSG